MRVLLDECLPRRLKHAFGSEHATMTVPERGWAGKKNGDLLALAGREFDVFVTVDVGVEFQQDLASSRLIIVLLRARNNRLDSLLPLIPKVLEQLATTTPGQLLRVAER